MKRKYNEQEVEFLRDKLLYRVEAQIAREFVEEQEYGKYVVKVRDKQIVINATTYVFYLKPNESLSDILDLMQWTRIDIQRQDHFTKNLLNKL